MGDSLGSELMEEARRVEVKVTGVEGVKELGVRVFRRIILSTHNKGRV